MNPEGVNPIIIVLCALLLVGLIALFGAFGGRR